ncbi:hypothetical protein PIB30_082343 [Stylosanthes scabra]|uniref:Uncharacterized protein n=1 Tax=Stylosanthes scabra TaxID=79078 RepID=A0ABU6ZQI8_9FABA|nr:hypothetical protein [Stylosanthes scabra]
MAIGGARPSHQYLLRYYQWAHLILTGFRDPVVPAASMIPGNVVDGIPEAPDMVQPEDGELPEVHPRVARRRRALAGEVVDEDRVDQMEVPLPHAWPAWSITRHSRHTSRPESALGTVDAGTPVQQTESFAHMTHETPPAAYEPRRQEVSGSDDSGDAHDVRGDIEGRLDRLHRETRPPPCGTGGCLDGRVVRRGHGRGGP